MVDSLSRLPNPETDPSTAESLVHRTTSRLLEGRIADLNLTVNNLSQETLRDLYLALVFQYLKTGWREAEYRQEMKPYYRKRNLKLLK